MPSGQSESSAKATLQAAGFKNITTSDQVSTTVKPGNVISITPGAGTKVVASTVITLTVAKAPPTAEVPNVEGKTGAEAESALGAAGFNVVETTQTVTDQSKNGFVLKQTPAAGKTETKKSTVTIVIGQYVPTSTTTTSSSTTTTSSSKTTTTTSSQT